FGQELIAFGRGKLAIARFSGGIRRGAGSRLRRGAPGARRRGAGGSFQSFVRANTASPELGAQIEDFVNMLFFFVPMLFETGQNLLLLSKGFVDFGDAIFVVEPGGGFAPEDFEF